MVIIGKEVGKYGFKRGRGWSGGERRRGCLFGCIFIVVGIFVFDVAEIRGYVWLVNCGLGILFYY